MISHSGSQKSVGGWIITLLSAVGKTDFILSKYLSIFKVLFMIESCCISHCICIISGQKNKLLLCDIVMKSACLPCTTQCTVCTHPLKMCWIIHVAAISCLPCVPVVAPCARDGATDNSQKWEHLKFQISYFSSKLYCVTHSLELSQRDGSNKDITIEFGWEMGKLSWKVFCSLALDSSTAERNNYSSWTDTQCVWKAWSLWVVPVRMLLPHNSWECCNKDVKARNFIGIYRRTWISRTRVCRIHAYSFLSRIIYLNQKCFIETNHDCWNSFHKSELSEVQNYLHFG